jgi:hypothetical protein
VFQTMATAMAKIELSDWSRPEYRRSELGELVRGKYAKLSKAEREKIESQYHRLKPEDFDEALARAKRHMPVAVSRSKRKSKASEKGRAA